MRILDLGKYRQARIWIGDLPDATYQSAKTVSYSIPAGRKSHRDIRKSAIELVIPTGPHSLYGLLGGELRPKTIDQLQIDVEVSSPNERLLIDSLATKVDEVHVGLPAEYTQAIFAGVDLAREELTMIAAGKLSISCAAHGIVGLCDAIYKHLAAALVKLFNIPSLEPSNEELLGIFPDTFS